MYNIELAKRQYQKILNYTRKYRSLRQYEKLYHYTNDEALLNIMQTDTLYLTNISFLNYKEELNYSIKLLKTVIKEKYSDSIDIGVYFSTLIKELGKYKNRLFILSLATENDSLPLWRNYSSGDGYSIGIIADELEKYIYSDDFSIIGKTKIYSNNHSFYSGPTIYDETKQKKIIERILELAELVVEDYYDKKDDNINEILDYLIGIESVLCNILYSYKGLYHKYENEYRISILVDESVINDCVCFRKKNGLIIPFIKVRINPKLIQQIMIGPMQRDVVAKDGLKMFLASLGKNIDVDTSAINIRS